MRQRIHLGLSSGISSSEILLFFSVVIAFTSIIHRVDTVPNIYVRYNYKKRKFDPLVRFKSSEKD